MAATNTTIINKEYNFEAAKIDESRALLEGKCIHRGHFGQHSANPEADLECDPSPATNQAVTISKDFMAPGHESMTDPSAALNIICFEITKTIKIMQKKGADLLKLQLRTGTCLTQAKKLLPHGRFNNWAKRRFGLSRSWCNSLMRAAAVEPVWWEASSWAVENGEPFEATPRGVLNLVKRYLDATGEPPEPQVGQEENKKLRDKPKTIKEKLAEAQAQIDAMKSAGATLIRALTSAGKPVDAAIFLALGLNAAAFAPPRQTCRPKVLERAPSLFDVADHQDAAGGAL